MTKVTAILCLFFQLFFPVHAFTPILREQYDFRRSLMTTSLYAQNKDSNAASETDANPLTKASWYAVEAFGKVFGSVSRKQNDSESTVFDMTKPPSTVDETFERIKKDNEREYFLSGQVDALIYDQNCIFADPFVSFKGRDRFIENLANLGSFITKYSAKQINYGVEENAVVTKFMVKLELNLPWRPVLAWPWGVRCEIDPDTKLIILHEESWDIKPWEGVKQIFRKPTLNV